jgi:hypothetical protein
MSKKNNWRHYHLERNGNSQGLYFQRYRRAWELIASLARTSPEDTWKVNECKEPRCQAPQKEAIA